MSWGGKLTLHGVTLRNGKTENYGGCGWVISHATLIANHVVMRDCWATEEAGGGEALGGVRLHRSPCVDTAHVTSACPAAQFTDPDSPLISFIVMSIVE